MIIFAIYMFCPAVSPDIKKILSGNTNVFQPALLLKKIILEGGIAYGKSCNYLSKKYPQMESLTLYLNTMTILRRFILPYKLTIDKMVVRFQQLKDIHVKFFDSELDARQDVRLLSSYNNQDLEFWPKMKFGIGSWNTRQD
ncbi:hypothetical protein BJ944DRAFT_228424 [Cunninghamella echinulata]|nr:hypothetical protein BJ944DRAFT_228424 [Cunninghamella echinulata]